MGIESYYVKGYEVQRATNVSDGAGSSTETLSKVSDIAGRMRPLTGNEILANEKLSLVTTHRFYCAITDVREGDYIYDSVKAKSYEVRFVKNPMEMDDHFEIDCYCGS